MATLKFVYPYKQQSRSALVLSKAIAGKVIKIENSRFRPKENKLVVNWGSTSLPREILEGCRILNHPEKVKLVSNKKTYFEAMSQGEGCPRIPPFTTSNEVAKRWIEEDPKGTIFARTVLNGHSGEGIVKVKLKEDLEKIADGTLLVKYIPKRREFRLHIAGDKVFCVQEKLQPIEKRVEEIDYQIRNVDNGFIFAKQDIQVPEDVIAQGLLAIKKSELDFGACDIIWNEFRKEAFVLEINSAPGLEGSTVDDYAGMINDQ